MRAAARILRGASAAVLGLVAVTGFVVPPAHAAPKPGKNEWWFIAWDIQNRVWKQTQGQGVTVAVVDSKINRDLPELRGVVHGGTRITSVGSDDEPYIDDPGGHGTAEAALIAGQGGGSGMVGVAPKAQILPIESDGSPTSLSKAIKYAADHGAQVIDVPRSSPYPGGCPGFDVQAAVSYATYKGSLVVAPMGDTGYAKEINNTLFPSSCGGVLGIGAVNDSKLAWTKTQRHSYVSVGAPGIGIDLVKDDGTLKKNVNGTGPASALAAGAVALIRSKFPQWSPREVAQHIINTTVDAGPKGRDNLTGTGVMVPILTLTKDVPKDAPNPTFRRLDKWRSQNPDLDQKPAGAGTSPSAGARSAGAAQATSDSSGIGMAIWVPVAGVLLVAVAGVVVLAVVLSRNRRRRPQPLGPPFLPGPGQPGTPGQYGMPPPSPYQNPQYPGQPPQYPGPQQQPPPPYPPYDPGAPPP